MFNSWREYEIHFLPVYYSPITLFSLEKLYGLVLPKHLYPINCKSHQYNVISGSTELLYFPCGLKAQGGLTTIVNNVMVKLSPEPSLTFLSVHFHRLVFHRFAASDSLQSCKEGLRLLVTSASRGVVYVGFIKYTVLLFTWDTKKD